MLYRLFLQIEKQLDKVKYFIYNEQRMNKDYEKD